MSSFHYPKLPLFWTQEYVKQSFARDKLKHASKGFWGHRFLLYIPKTMAPSSIADLCLDLHLNILSRRPIKYLMQLRCVSKQWGSIIDNPSFATFYLSRNKQQCVLHLENTNLCILGGGHDGHLKPLHNSVPPLNLGYHKVYNLEASCKGLLLFTCKINSCFTVENPFKPGPVVLPRLDHGFRGWKSLGFGCENSTNKFKVVCVYDDEDEVKKVTRTRTLVHTSGTSSWREIGEIPPCALSDNNSVYANGFLHWLIKGQNPGRLIVSFNLGSEKFNFTPHPEFRSGDSTLFGLFDLKGNLGMSDLSSCGEYIDIWVVGDDMKKWKREIRIGMQTIWETRWVVAANKIEWALEYEVFRNQRMRRATNNGDNIKVIGMWKEGEILLQSDRGFLVYSVESDIMRRQESIIGLLSPPKVICHQPSLISASSFVFQFCGYC